ncbi:pyridoxamine 5'-phosphate oxidase [Hyphococcus flavus]|uniref:Pyridoxine/pyridoxamine 5'-phosphate oxidase n=1 Tax=Hyphococcus flavus TaxID=1866326 RepID=A0AAE9ZAL6_9PROT|nr:pyridoxamine 5'-phosphate oxidase [Hyphococcus flavus]WDI30211.1 pyridoxamine 5'-phosphate oxidase [Hyphococcus flavus]
MKSENLIPPSPNAEAYAVDDDQGDVFSIGDPFALFAEWLALAGKTEPNDPNTMALATVDEAGMPDVRMVLLKDFDACGLTFYTNVESAKGRQLAANPKAAVCFHWKTIRRQVRFRGDIAPVSDEEADEYFASRARGAQLGAHASAQSRPLDDRAKLEAAIAALDKDYDSDVSRPKHWSGYRLKPVEIEFWVNRPYRLHDRLQYVSENNDWVKQKLYP